MKDLPKELIIYEENKPKVLQALKDGRIDYVALSKWGFVDRLFGFLVSTKFFEWCASTYPSPRVKEEIPVWFLLACAIQMKLHTETAFDNLPGILQSGSILSRIKFNIGIKDGGFNHKNTKPRGSVVDQDTVRKYYKDTNPDSLEEWYNEEVTGWMRRHRGFEKEGIFILDASFLPVPDNPNYERTGFLPLDDEGSFIDVKALSEEEKAQIKYKPCYSFTSLLHMSGEGNHFVYSGMHLGPGTDSPLKQGEKLVDGFVKNKGKGIIKWLIADRGFIDGRMISRFKRDYSIDTLIPLKSNMDILTDALGIASLEKTKWMLYREGKDSDGNLIREEITAVKELKTWDSCTVDIYVALMRKINSKGEIIQQWGLASTRPFKDPAEAFDLYHKRTQIEERHRQLKLCWLLYKFTSPNFSLIMMHVVFTVLVYSIIQMYLSRKGLRDLANKTINTLRRDERLGKDAVVVYAKGYFAILDLDETMYITVTLEGAPRKRLTKWLKDFKDRRTRAP
jgi:hypothetical protein